MSYHKSLLSMARRADDKSRHVSKIDL